MTSTVYAPAAPAPVLPSSMTTLFGSMKRSSGGLAVQGGLHLKVAFGELKLDLRDAVFPREPVLLVAESLCASARTEGAGQALADTNGHPVLIANAEIDRVANLVRR